MVSTTLFNPAISFVGQLEPVPWYVKYTWWESVASGNNEERVRESADNHAAMGFETKVLFIETSSGTGAWYAFVKGGAFASLPYEGTFTSFNLPASDKEPPADWKERFIPQNHWTIDHEDTTLKANYESAIDFTVLYGPSKEQPADWPY